VHKMMTVDRRSFLTGSTILIGCSAFPALAAVTGIIPQPYFAGVMRAMEALAAAGQPMAKADADRLSALAAKGDAEAVTAAEAILDRYTLARVTATEDGYFRTEAGNAPKTLIEQGWSVFLVRVANPLGSTAALQVTGPDTAISLPSTGASRAGVYDSLNVAPRIAQIWYRNELYQLPPIGPTLSGGVVDYQLLQIYSRDRGSREMDLNFYTSTERYAGWRLSSLHRGARLKFNALPSRNILLHVRDADGRGCMASLIIRDKRGRIYPLQAMRLAPDMYFQPQIYRADGENVHLPDGDYIVESRRGPEYLAGTQQVRIDENQEISVRLQRWIDPAKWGWYSGDTHIHGGGCAHYEHPTEGVSPETMIRHVRGEGLSIGDVLSWGPSWYYQKQFFTGQAISPPASLEHPDLQAADNASLKPIPTPEDAESSLRYDMEVAGFPSSHCGHLVLLRLKEQDYPGTTLIQDWPSWNLPILKWAKAQGGLVGYSHCGFGMEVASTELPNYEIPPMNSIGTQEAIVDVTHDVTDFLSGCDTPPIAELNAWYHMLNCGSRLALIGETDYPCISGERAGRGRSYVRLNERPVGNAGYEAWIANLAKGKLYCGDGRSHFLDWSVAGRSSGESDVQLSSPKEITIRALVAARLKAEVQPIQDNREVTPTPPPEIGWHLERARIGTSRKVPVELIVNGEPVERVEFLADGKPRPVTFTTKIQRSSWVALRILPSAHTHPVFVVVGDKPIRASKRSAQWCRDCVDKLWEVKSPMIREAERPAAAEAYDHARRAYDQIIAESEAA